MLPTKSEGSGCALCGQGFSASNTLALNSLPLRVYELLLPTALKPIWPTSP